MADLGELDPSTFTDPEEFAEAIASFAARVPMTRADWDRLTEEAKQYGFTVGGTMQADVIQQVFDALHASIKDGTPFADFKRQISSTLLDAWQGSVANPPARLNVIFRTNIIAAQSAGRHRQMSHPIVKELRPVWRMNVIEDNRVSKYCSPLDGLLVRADNPWWQHSFPPRHYQCRSLVDTLSEEEAEAEGGITEHPPNVPAMEGFGRPPAQPVPHFEPDHDEYDPALSDLLARRLDDPEDYESDTRLRAQPLTAEQAVARLLMLLAA